MVLVNSLKKEAIKEVLKEVLKEEQEEIKEELISVYNSKHKEEIKDIIVEEFQRSEILQQLIKVLYSLKKSNNKLFKKFVKDFDSKSEYFWGISLLKYDNIGEELNKQIAKLEYFCSLDYAKKESNRKDKRT